MSKLFEKPKYSKAQCEEVFKRDGNLAMKIKRENPQEFAELRAAAEYYKILGPQPRSASPVVRMVQDAQTREEAKANRTLTTEEAKACAMFSKADCEALFKGKGQETGDIHNASALKKSSPEKFRLAKIAGIVHGVLPAQPYPAPISAPVAPEPDGRLTISDSLAADLNVPKGTKIEANELPAMIQIASEAKAAKGDNNE